MRSTVSSLFVWKYEHLYDSLQEALQTFRVMEDTVLHASLQLAAATPQNLKLAG